MLTDEKFRAIIQRYGNNKKAEIRRGNVDERERAALMGGIIGDVCGSVYEFDNLKTEDPKSIDLLNPRCEYTDDSVMQIAVMKGLMDRTRLSGTYGFAERYREFGAKYPHPMGGYGTYFKKWLRDPNMGPYGSYGNGSAMRVGPVGWIPDYGKRLSFIVPAARASAELTHNHPEGIRGAEAIAAAVFTIRDGKGKDGVKYCVEDWFGYDLRRTLDEIRPEYKFDGGCPGTVPVAVRAFLESDSFEHAIQLAISVGGDSDTIACITGTLAGAYYVGDCGEGPSEELVRFVDERLPQEFHDVIVEFMEGRDTHTHYCYSRI